MVAEDGATEASTADSMPGEDGLIYFNVRGVSMSSGHC